MSDIRPDTNALVIAAREIAYDFTVQEAMGKERSDALDKALEPFADQVGWDDDLTSEGEAAKQARVEHFETPTLKELYDEAVKDVYRKPDAPQPAKPDLEVVGWKYEFNEFGDVWARGVILNRPDGGANLPTKHYGSAVRGVTPLVRLTDAQAHISALTAKVEELTRRICPVDPGGSDRIDELESANDFLKHRAETAEARVVQLEELLDRAIPDTMEYDAESNGFYDTELTHDIRSALGGQNNEA